MDPLKATLLLGILQGLIILTTQEKEKVIVGIRGKAVSFPCVITDDIAERLQWADFVYNSNRDPKVIFEAQNNPDAEISADHPRAEDITLDKQHTLKIANIDLNDAGVYFCRISNSDGSFTELHRYRLQVMGMPKCTGEGIYKEGDNAELLCAVVLNGNQVPKITWMSRGVDQSGDDDTTLEEFKKTLTLSLADDNDQQEFVCTVSFVGLTESCKVKLEVKYSARDIKIEPEGKKYAVGDMVKCSARGNPSPNIEWKPKVQSKNGPGFKSFEIPAEWLGKSKTLSCRASNPGDKATNFLSKNITMIPIEAPSGGAGKTAAYFIGSFLSTGVVVPLVLALLVTNLPPLSRDGLAQILTSIIITSLLATGGGVPMIAIIIGVVAGLFVLIVLIAIIIIARRKSAQKTKGHKPVPTSDKEALKNDMDAKA